MSGKGQGKEAKGCVFEANKTDKGMHERELGRETVGKFSTWHARTLNQSRTEAEAGPSSSSD